MNLDDPGLSVECRACMVRIGQWCKENKRKRKYLHIVRYRDLRNAELERRRRFRDAYLAKWFLTYGFIFEE